MTRKKLDNVWNEVFPKHNIRPVFQSSVTLKLVQEQRELLLTINTNPSKLNGNCLISFWL